MIKSNKSVMSADKIRREVQKLRESAHLINLTWNPAHNRFDGHNSIDFNRSYKNLLKQLKNAEEHEYKNRPPEQKIRYFKNLKDNYLRDANKVSNPSMFRQILLLGNPSISRNDKNQESSALKELRKAAYCVEITGDKCKHFQEGRCIKCDCRAGKQDPSKKILHESILDHDLHRKILLVIVNGEVIDINDDQTHLQVRQAIREKVPMINKKSKEERLQDINSVIDRFGDNLPDRPVSKIYTVEGTDEGKVEGKVEGRAEEGTVEVTDEEDTSEGIFSGRFVEEKKIIQELCDNSFDVVKKLGWLGWFPMEFQEAISTELAANLKKSFLPMNLYACNGFGHHPAHLLELITEYKINYLRGKFPEHFPREEEMC